MKTVTFQARMAKLWIIGILAISFTFIFIEWAAHRDHAINVNIFLCNYPSVSLIISPIICHCMSYNFSTNISMILEKKLHNISTSIIKLEASTDLMNDIIFREYTKKLMKDLCLLSVHPSPIIVHPISAQVLWKLSIVNFTCCLHDNMDRYTHVPYLLSC